MFTARRENSSQSRRVKQPWPKGKAFKILSLDGGGIRGYYTVEFLRHCEKRFLKPNENIADYFDLIAGTSTGGLIALGLGNNIPIDQIKKFYEDDGRVIFPPYPRSLLGKIRQTFNHFLKPKLSADKLEASLKEIFGLKLLGQSQTRLVIPSCLMPTTEIVVFKTDHHADYKYDWKTEAWKIARATSAAPTYLSGIEEDESGKVFVDGGIWANNPIMAAVIDALTSYDISVEQIHILSIGTGNPPYRLSKKAVFGGLFSWREVIKASMFLSTDNALAQAILLLGPEQVLRVEPAGKAADIELDDYDTAMILLPDAARNAADLNENGISQFFQVPVSRREFHYFNLVT